MITQPADLKRILDQSKWVPRSLMLRSMDTRLVFDHAPTQASVQLTLWCSERGCPERYRAARSVQGVEILYLPQRQRDAILIEALGELEAAIESAYES